MNQNITAQDIIFGKSILPAKIIELMSPEEWEEFIWEWLDTKKEQYFKIEKYGGSGDMGRDVVAYITDPKENSQSYEWECYQCKHYDNALMPSNVWVEFGKIIYYTYTSKFPIPKVYYFVAPHGVGTSLSTLLDNYDELRKQLKDNWEQYCKKKITNEAEIDLSPDLVSYIDSFDFKIFDKLNSNIIINEHKKHSNHLIRFGGRLPSRENIELPDIKDDEHLPYVKQLVKAYDSAHNEAISDITQIPKSYNRHFTDARKSFYKAEELRVLTRDNLSEEIFMKLKDEIYDGVINTVEETHDNGFKKAKAVEDKAVNIKIESNPLRETCQTIDKKGLCHHLVNDEKITWVEENE